VSTRSVNRIRGSGRPKRRQHDYGFELRIDSGGEHAVAYRNGSGHQPEYLWLDPRIFDRQSNEWKDGDALFMRCSIWREAAENVAESLTRGSRVVVQGRLKQRSYETREGEKRTVVELEVDEIGPSLRYATAKVNKASRSGGGGGGFGSGGGSRSSGGDSSEAKTDDPWGSAPASGSFSGGDDEPPF